jgi:DNA invertase Pin-like site-specific DNA recombinase
VVRAAPAAPSCRSCSIFCAPGDTLVVTRIDRLARSLKDLQDIVHELKNRGVALKAPNSRRYRHGSGQAFLDMLGVFAEFETNLRCERQLEGSMPQRRAVSIRVVSRRSMLLRSCGSVPPAWDAGHYHQS